MKNVNMSWMLVCIYELMKTDAKYHFLFSLQIALGFGIFPMLTNQTHTDGNGVLHYN